MIVYCFQLLWLLLLTIRYYDSNTCRFINADESSILELTKGQAVGHNLFAYCGNDPINNVDPTGYIAINIICALIGGIVGWIFGDYVAKKLGYKKGWKYWAIRGGVVVGGAIIGWFVRAAITAIINKFLIANPSVAMKLSTKILSAIGFAKNVANKAASSVKNFVVKSYHLMNGTGKWSKFATTSQNDIRLWISRALTKGSNFVVNSKDSYYVVYNIGKVIGTNGETKIRVVFTFAGKIITAFPVK